KCSRIAAALFGSLAARLSSVSSERTTPQPKVSSGRLRSNTTTSCAASRSFIEIAKYRPAGPPPSTATFIRCHSPLLYFDGRMTLNPTPFKHKISRLKYFIGWTAMLSCGVENEETGDMAAMIYHQIDEWDDAYANGPNIPQGERWPAAWAELAQAFRDR